MPRKEQIICEQIRWIDIIDPTHQEMEELSRDYNLNQNIVRDCMQPEHLPKYEYVDEVHFLILRYFSHSFEKKVFTIQDLTNKIAIFYSESFLITIHMTEAKFLDLIRNKYVAGGKCVSTTDLLTLIVWNSLETYDDPANRLSEQVDFYENQVMLKNSDTDPVEALYLIKREASIGHKVLMLMSEPINHIYIKPGEETKLQDVRDQHLKMQTLFNMVMEDCHNLLNLSMSFSSKKTNDVMKVLTKFSVFFLPITFIAGVYGMNFQFMPELGKKWGYPAALVLMAIVTGVIYVWFRKKKWM